MFRSIQSWEYKSKIHGQGVFAKSSIPKNTIVLVWGGKLLSTEDLKNGLGVPHTTVAISDGLWLSASSEQEKTTDDYINHSCDPNIGMFNEIALITIKNIDQGEELTADYCIWLTENDYKMKNLCRCGTSNCRKNITGLDWRAPEVQSRLFPYFSPLLKKRLMPY